MSRYWLSTQN
uniref:Uncharacterized protein n=1 Tax=Rhizophora mucronata TaxID=61149 RepID=A0A2P2J398_RHIMU